MPTPPTRRAVLRAAGAGVAGAWLAACTAGSSPEPPRPPTPDELARTAASTREMALAERASRTAVRHPALTVASAAATAHSAHADALRETLPPAATGSPSGSPSGAAVPSDESAAADELAAAESAAAEAHRAALSTDVTGDLARLLASVSASDAAFADAVRAQGSAA